MRQLDVGGAGAQSRDSDGAAAPDHLAPYRRHRRGRRGFFFSFRFGGLRDCAVTGEWINWDP